jgi:hypothetical protein
MALIGRWASHVRAQVALTGAPRVVDRLNLRRRERAVEDFDLVNQTVVAASTLSVPSNPPVGLRVNDSLWTSVDSAFEDAVDIQVDRAAIPSRGYVIPLIEGERISALHDSACRIRKINDPIKSAGVAGSEQGVRYAATSKVV